MRGAFICDKIFRLSNGDGWSQPPPFRVRHDLRTVKAQSFCLLILAISLPASLKWNYICKCMTIRFGLNLRSIMNKGKLYKYIGCNERGSMGASSGRVGRATKIHASQLKRHKLDSGLSPVGHLSLGLCPTLDLKHVN